MPTFQYRALDPSGAIVEGQLDARTRREALGSLDTDRLQPVRLDEVVEASRSFAGMGRDTEAAPRVSQRALEAFTRQLSALLGAGVPLASALSRLSSEASGQGAKTQWRSIYELVIDGTSLADAMARFPKVFPRVYTAMVRAGETGGFLDIVLEEIADFQSREKELKAKVLSAAIYPAVLAGLAVVVVLFLMIYFIPKFEGIFSDFDAALPLLTRCIVMASDLARKYALGVIVATVVAFIAFKRWSASEQGRRQVESATLGSPVIGLLVARFAMVRFCRMLGTLTGSGVPLMEALNVALQSVGNQVLVDAVREAVTKIEQGSRLADGLAGCPQLFPGSVLEIISIAEQTGRLDKELVRLATVTESDLDQRLRIAVSLAEPILLFVMAAAIGTIVIGMVLPIFALQDYIK